MYSMHGLFEKSMEKRVDKINRQLDNVGEQRIESLDTKNG